MTGVEDAVLDHLHHHDGPWTEAAYLDLAAAGAARGEGRVELVDGALIIGPGPTGERAGVVERMREALATSLPGGLRVLGPVALRLGPDCVLVPDLVVARAVDAPEPAAEAEDEPAAEDEAADEGPAAEVVDAEDVLMIVEVVGREHGATHRLFKPQIYARSRIPYSVLIDRHAPFAVADMIISGRYHEYARAAEDSVLTLEEPFPLTVALGAETDRPE